MRRAARRLVTPLAALLTLAPLLCAAQLHVPGGFATLQAAIDAASPGDVIVIHGGVHAPVVIDKDLYLVGEAGNRPSIRYTQPGEETVAFVQDPAIRLAGSFDGTLTLSCIDIGGTTDGSYFGTPGNAIAGDGFAQLALLHCDVRAPEWFFPTGVGFAADAIRLQPGVPNLLVSDSTVIGGEGVYDFPPSGPFDIPRGGDAIHAPDSAVTVLDSHVAGGPGLDMVFVNALYCPSDCNDVDQGEGGDAVEALAVYHAGSILEGGPGAEVWCSFAVANQFLCTRASGQTIAGASSVVALPGTLFGSGPMRSASYWTLTWVAPSPSAYLVLSPFPRPPLAVPGKGLLFMPAGALVLVPVFGSGLQAGSFWIPADSALHGFPLVMQLYDPVLGLRRPVTSAIVPN